MQANIFKTDTAFKLNDAYYIIQAISPTKMDTELFCKPYDPLNAAPEKTRQAYIFSASELKRNIIEGDACLIDPFTHQTNGLNLTDRQIEMQDMWLDFTKQHWERNGGKNLTSVANVEESIALFNWYSYNCGPKGKSTCQEKISKFFLHSDKNAKSLINWGGESDKGQSRLPEAIELIILKNILNHYLVRKGEKEYSRNKIADLIIEEIKILKANDPQKYSVVPSKQSIYDRFELIHPLTIADKQLSKQEQKKLKHRVKAQLVGNYPLERVEMDAIYIAIGLLDEDGKKYLGTVVLMVAIDTFTRCVVGYSISVGKDVGESSDLAVECLKHAIMPKSNPKWPVYGKSTFIVSDATTATKGNTYKQTALDLGINPITVRVGEAWAKPFIERFFLTLRIEFLSELKGYLGSKRYKGTRHLNPKDKIEKHARLKVSEFIEKFEEFITDYYHVSGHAGLNDRAPIDIWNYEIGERPLLVTAPTSDCEALNYKGLRYENRTVYELGYVKVQNEIYVSEDLKSLWLHKVREVTIYYSDIDATSVVIPIKDKKLQKELGKKLIIAERRNTSYEPLLPFRSSIDAAREAVNGHLPKKSKKRYPPGKGIQPLPKASPETEETDNAKGSEAQENTPKTNTGPIDNNKAADLTAPDAQEQIDEASESWLCPKNQQVPEIADKNQPSNITIKVGKVL